MVFIDAFIDEVSGYNLVEHFLGSNCTGANNTINRTLTTVGFPVGNEIVIVQTAHLHRDIDYTVSGNVITFLIAIQNGSNITVMT